MRCIWGSYIRKYWTELLQTSFKESEKVCSLQNQAWFWKNVFHAKAYRFPVSDSKCTVIFNHATDNGLGNTPQHVCCSPFLFWGYTLGRSFPTHLTTPESVKYWRRSSIYRFGQRLDTKYCCQRLIPGVGCSDVEHPIPRHDTSYNRFAVDFRKLYN